MESSNNDSLVSAGLSEMVPLIEACLPGRRRQLVVTLRAGEYGDVPYGDSCD